MLIVQNHLVTASPPIARNPINLVTFLGLAFILSWTGASIVALEAYAAQGAEWAELPWLPAAAPLKLLMLFGPLLAAIIALFWNYGWGGTLRFAKKAFRLNLPLIAWVVVLAGPIFIFGLVWPLGLFFGATAQPPDIGLSILVSAGQLLVFYLLFNTEELAWRGYALPQLQALLSPLAANAVLTAIWAFFHLPLFAMPGGHPAGYDLPVFLLMVIPIGFIMGAVFNRAAGSVLIVHLLHQGFNAWSEAFQVFPVFTGENHQMLIAIGILWIFGLAAMAWLGLQRRAR